MKDRAKIGLFFLGGESWWEAGVCDAQEGPFAGFIDKVESDVASITKHSLPLSEVPVKTLYSG